GQRRPGRPNGAQEVNVDAGGPAGLVMAGAEAGGIIDQGVDAAERRAGLADVMRHRGRIGEIADGGMRLDPAFGDLAAHPIECLGAAGADRDGSPGLAKASAIARPMPRLPPVTTARLPERSMFMARPPTL